MLDATGHRLSVSELAGRTVNHGYDSIYRLTNETRVAYPLRFCFSQRVGHSSSSRSHHSTLYPFVFLLLHLLSKDWVIMIPLDYLT
jgi:hypothetical protein